MLSCLEFKSSISAFKALKPLYVFATAAHGEIPVLLLFCLSQLSEMSLPSLSASHPASTGREEQKTVKEPTTKSSLCNPPASSHYKPQPCVCTTRTAASALQSPAEGHIPAGGICSSLCVSRVSFCHCYPTPFLPLPIPYTIMFVCVQFLFIYLSLGNTMAHGFSGNL